MFQIIGISLLPLLYAEEPRENYAAEGRFTIGEKEPLGGSG